jgi:hypothetical protein
MNRTLTEPILSRGELSSGSLSSSKSVSNISVASDIGRGASAFMLKNESRGCPFWNISTLGSIGVVGERGYPTSVCDPATRGTKRTMLPEI